MWRAAAAPVPSSALALLERSREGLLAGFAERTAAQRYVAAHLAALRAAAAVLAVLGRPGTRRSGPRSVWEVLPDLAPELGEWASFFASSATVRAAVEAGRPVVVSVRAADDLLRAAESFHRAVETAIGLPGRAVLPPAVPVLLPGHG